MITTLVTFAGNLAHDPELRFTTVSGKAVAEFRVLVNRRVKDITDQWVDAEPTPFQCKVWGSSATNVAESLQKGDRVIVQGLIETETWTDKDTGEKRTQDIVNVDEVGASLAWTAAKPEKHVRTNVSVS